MRSKTKSQIFSESLISNEKTPLFCFFSNLIKMQHNSSEIHPYEHKMGNASAIEHIQLLRAPTS